MVLVKQLQLHSITISKNLRKFFNKSPNNTINFWDCPSDNKWPPYLLVDKESKFHKISPILSSKISWYFYRKEECDSIVKKQQIYFQASNYKRKNFLDLNDNYGYLICPSYSKDSVWLKYFELFNSLYVWITRLITNYTSIGKYRQRFFPNESIACSCGNSLYSHFS